MQWGAVIWTKRVNTDLGKLPSALVLRRWALPRALLQGCTVYTSMFSSPNCQDGIGCWKPAFKDCLWCLSSSFFCQHTIQKRTLCLYEIRFGQLSLHMERRESFCSVCAREQFQSSSCSFHLSISHHSVHFTKNSALRF